jgi:alkanesulfonate monooxygenase SsuD/methylene tetrahydromethanopterin reductase-like flavin-dependent oxidoreductase (luciferase family)
MLISVFDLMAPTPQMPAHREVLARTYEQLDLADRVGIHGFYLAEHHFDPPYSITGCPNLIIAQMATRSKNLRLGVMTTVLPYQHPVRVAEEIRTLDMLCDGRLDVAFGRGALRLEQQGWGVERSQTHEIFETSYDLVRRLLVEGSIESYNTRWWKGGRVELIPEATQKPHPPFWHTAVSFTSCYRAGRLGMHCATAFRSNDERIETVENYRAGWEEWEVDNPGSRPGLYGSAHHVFVGETLAECEKWARPNLEGWMEHFLKIISDRPVDGEDPSYDTHKRHHLGIRGSSWEQMVEDCRVVYGTPDQVVDQLRRMGESGMDMLIAHFQYGHLDLDASRRSMKLFCEEVLPKVRNLPTSIPSSTSRVSA